MSEVTLKHVIKAYGSTQVGLSRRQRATSGPLWSMRGRCTVPETEIKPDQCAAAG